MNDCRLPQSPTWFWIALALVGLIGLLQPTSVISDGPSLRLVYFSAADCPHCAVVESEVLAPLQAEYGDRMQIKVVEVSDPANYEILIRAEELFSVAPERRGLPSLLVDGAILIGEDEIREQLPCLLDACLAKGGTAWPDIPGLAEIAVTAPVGAARDFTFGMDGTAGETCVDEDTAVCTAPPAIWMAYFYEVGCQECGRAVYDIRLLQSRFPQLIVEEHSVQDEAPLAEWLAERVGLPESDRLATPSIFIGDDVLIGTAITYQSLLAIAEKYPSGGAPRFWSDFDPEEGQRSIIERFQSFGVLAVAVAGLVDGLNPCAFATLVFFVSYLTLSGRRGKQVLAVGAAFTLGVFLAYLAVGLGFYRVLDALGALLTTLGRWVYGLTALLCAVLAVLSLRDALAARRGDLGDMMLSLPHHLRMRINAVIRGGRGSRAFVAGAFATGVVVSFLELACTGQVYLPTIIFVVSRPELRTRAVAFLLVYNILFVLPLVIVFILAYYGTGAKQLSRFLERHAAAVKVGMAMVFATLAVWLGFSVVSVV